VGIHVAPLPRGFQNAARGRAPMTGSLLEDAGLHELAGQRAVDEYDLAAVVSHPFPGGGEAFDARPDDPRHASNERRGTENVDRRRCRTSTSRVRFSAPSSIDAAPDPRRPSTPRTIASRSCR
jgi:hypothetical protein